MSDDWKRHIKYQTIAWVFLCIPFLVLLSLALGLSLVVMLTTSVVTFLFAVPLLGLIMYGSPR